MKKRVLLVFMLSAVICIFSSGNVFAAWTQAKGHSYNQLSLSHYKTTKKYTTLHREDNGTIEGDVYRGQQEEFKSLKVSYYGEYGITDKVTVVGSVPYDWQKSNDTQRFAGEDGPSGVGDINLGLRYQLVPNLFGSGVLMSAQGEVKIPEAYDFEHPLFNLSLGDGQYDASAILKFGRGLPKGYVWMDIGYKWRFENNEFESYKPSDRFIIKIGGGYPLLSWVSLTGSLDFFKSVGNAEVSDEMVQRSFSTGLDANTAKLELTKDTLTLETDDVSGSLALWFNLPKKFKANNIVLSYTKDLSGFGNYFRTRNGALGQTISLALVCSGKGAFIPCLSE